jgi:hypothetical protein
MIFQIEVGTMRHGLGQRGVIAHTGVLLGVAALVFAATHTCAAELEPRAYVNTPVGLNFLIAGYAYSEGGLSTNASSPLKDAQLKIHTQVLAYARTLDVWGKSGKFDIIQPTSQLSGSAMVDGQRRERQVSGLLDPRFRFSVNFYGAPALSMQEFANYRQDTLIGASVQVSAPVGQYDSSKLVNLGNNRWSIKPDIGISKAFGPLTLELTAGVTFFTNNEDYFGGNTLEQDPVYSTQAHVTYNFGRGMWGSLDGTYDYGGRTTVNGVRVDDVQRNSRVGVTLALPVNRNNSIKLYGSTGVSTRTGHNYNLGGIAWQYRWGDGL